MKCGFPRVGTCNFINIQQRTKTQDLLQFIELWCNFINIQQRTKTLRRARVSVVECNFINIQQRTKTSGNKQQ